MLSLTASASERIVKTAHPSLPQVAFLTFATFPVEGLKVSKLSPASIAALTAVTDFVISGVPLALPIPTLTMCRCGCVVVTHTILSVLTIFSFLVIARIWA